MKLIITTFLCLLLSYKLFAGKADLSIEMEFNEIDGIVYDASGYFTARITNLGPDIAAENAQTQFPIAMLSSIILGDNISFIPEIEFALDPQQDNSNCFLVVVIGDPLPDGTVAFTYDINVPSLAFNETVECFGIYRRSFPSGTRDVTWRVRNNFDTDPNPNNDNQVITFGVAPRPVPTNSPWVIIIMGVLVLLLGLRERRQ